MRRLWEREKRPQSASQSYGMGRWWDENFFFKRIKEWIKHQDKSSHLCRKHKNVHLLPGNLQIYMPAKRNQKYLRRRRPLAGLFQSRSWHNDGLQRAVVLMMWCQGHASNLGQTLSQKDTPKSLADDASTKKRTQEWGVLNYTQATSTIHLQTDVSKMLAKKWRSHIIEQLMPVPNTLCFGFVATWEKTESFHKT